MDPTRRLPEHVRSESSFFPDGRVGILQRGRVSQGEANVKAVAEALVRHLGTGYSWASRDGLENGTDFYLSNPDGCRREVQVVRAVDRTFCAALGRHPTQEVQQVSLREDTVKTVARAISAKTRRTPSQDRAQRILAVDVLETDFSVFWATGTLHPRWWDKAHQWVNRRHWYAVYVVGARKFWPFMSSSVTACGVASCRP
jgi:hypothetical protein